MRIILKGSTKFEANIKLYFISYVQRAQKVFGENEPVDRKTRRHMLKIRRILDEIFL